MMKRTTFLVIVLCWMKGVTFSQLLKFQAQPLTGTGTCQKYGGSGSQVMAAGDTVFHITLPGYYVDAANAGSFMIDTVDVDQLVPDPGTIQETSWGVYSSTIPTDIDSTQGDVDTGFFYAATSYFTPVGVADNWLILGPVTIPSAGATLSWKTRELDPAFKDGYEVLATTTGGLPGNFTSPPLYAVPDNAPSLDTSWVMRTVLFDSTLYGGVNVWIAFHHNANNQFILLIDNILLTEADTTTATGNNDECTGAVDINGAFGAAIGAVITMGPYDNDSATTSTLDPVTGFECFGEPDGTSSAPELNNTLWYTFTGDGEIYFIETGNCAGVTDYIDDGDTQLALYSGSCGTLTPVACNEDGPSATTSTYPAGFTITTTPGTIYYLMVDGFNATALGGGISNGQFCLKITHIAAIGCTDSTVTAGTESQNDTNICFMDTIIVSTANAVSPNIGSYFGIGWVISSADISGSNDPLNDPSFITTYSFTSPPPPVSTRLLINDGTIGAIQPGTTYYWTPVIFANATASAAIPVFLGDLTLDTACVTTGTSLMAHFLIQGDPLCTIGIAENLPGKNVSVSAYPSPADEVLNIDFMADKKARTVITITDNIGQVVQSKIINGTPGINKVTLKISELAAGYYFVNVKTNDNSLTTSFAKNKN